MYKKLTIPTRTTMPSIYYCYIVKQQLCLNLTRL